MDFKPVNQAPFHIIMKNYNDYLSGGGNQRLGQYFCNQHMHGATTVGQYGIFNLYYSTDYNKCAEYIKKLCSDWQW